MKKFVVNSVAFSLFAGSALAQAPDHVAPVSPVQVQPGEQRPAMPFGTTADHRSMPMAPVPTTLSPVQLSREVQEQEHPEMQTGSAGAPMPDLLDDAKGDPRPIGFFESRAASMNPTLRQAEAQIARLRAEAKQQGLWQNPEIGYEADHIRGGSYAGGEQGGYVQQTIPLAGQRSSARAAVESQVRQAEEVVEQQRERVHSAVDQAFYAALAAQQEADLRLQLADVANETSVNAHQLANVGQADAPDVLQFEIEREEAKLAAVVAQRVYRKAFAQLAAVSGGGVLAICLLQGDLDAVPVLPLSQGGAAAESSPTLRVAEQKIAAQDAALRSARRQTMPQLTVHAGLQNSNEPLEGSGRVGIVGVAQAGLTLPLWNRNQGAVDAVKAERVSAEAETERTRLLLHARGEATVQDYAAAMETVRRYREELLPRATRSRILYQQKYATMAAGYPQVLLSAKTLLQLRVEYVHALRDAWQSAILLQNGLLQDGFMMPERVGDLPEGTLGGTGMR